MGGSFWPMIPERPKFSSTSLEYMARSCPFSSMQRVVMKSLAKQ